MGNHPRRPSVAPPSSQRPRPGGRCPPFACRSVLRVAALLAVTFLLTACGMSIPADPDGTLERVTDGQLRVGVSHNPPWTDTAGGGTPSGTESELIADFAAAHDAEVVWERGGEEQLMKQLRDGQLDVVIGGLTDKSPWTTHAALTTSYVEATGNDGTTEKHVLAVSMGENAFMVALERHALTHAEAHR